METLKDLISDSNPMVVANAVAALAEIQESSSKSIFEITSHILFKLLAALNECTEYVLTKNNACQLIMAIPIESYFIDCAMFLFLFAACFLIFILPVV